MLGQPELCVGGIAVRNGELLLIQRGRGASIGEWSIPGGRVEFGETMVEAVKREIAEETGLDVEVREFVGWVERRSADHHFVIVDFVVNVVSGTLRAGDDAADARWIPLDGLASLPLVDGLVEFLRTHGVLS